MKDNCVILFLAAPSPERIDPQLKTALGAERACQVYADVARQVFRELKKLKNVYPMAVYKGDSNFPDLRWLDADDPGFLVPRGDTDEERFFSAARWPFEAGAKRVIILSALAPGVPAGWLDNAFEALKEKHLALGVTAEGDCYAIGMNGLYPSVFAGYPWEGKRFADIIAERAKYARLSIYSLPEFYIVKDGKTCCKEIPQEGGAVEPDSSAPAKKNGISS